MIDLAFGIAVASLPTLNALLPQSWRKGAAIVHGDARYHNKRKSTGYGSSPKAGESRVRVNTVIAMQEVPSSGSSASEKWEQKKWGGVHIWDGDAVGLPRRTHQKVDIAKG